MSKVEASAIRKSKRATKFRYVVNVLENELADLEESRADASDEEPWTRRIIKVKMAIEYLRQLEKGE